jgi:hypothetical protein
MALRFFLNPESSMAVQHALGADIVMVLDECTPFPATEAEARILWNYLCVGRSAVKYPSRTSTCRLILKKIRFPKTQVNSSPSLYF